VFFGDRSYSKSIYYHCNLHPKIHVSTGTVFYGYALTLNAIFRAMNSIFFPINSIFRVYKMQFDPCKHGE
jgi:hypothetical protein